MPRYYTINKPFNVLSQFTSTQGKATLADYFDVPKNVYPVGRLDYDSEGLLILTDDALLNKRLLDPANKHERQYWAQVEGTITSDACETLRNGVDIRVEGKSYTTRTCKAFAMDMPPVAWQREPPIRYRKNVADSWLRLILTEGKNRQVRRMTAKVGFATLRLIRVSIEQVTLEGLQPGHIKEWSRDKLLKGLFG